MILPGLFVLATVFAAHFPVDGAGPQSSDQKPMMGNPTEERSSVPMSSVAGETMDEAECITRERTNCKAEASKCVKTKYKQCKRRCIEEKTMACRHRKGPRCVATDRARHCCRHWYDYLGFCFAWSLSRCDGPPAVTGVPCVGADGQAAAFDSKVDDKFGAGVAGVPVVIKSDLPKGMLDRADTESLMAKELAEDAAWKAGKMDAPLGNEDIHVGIGANDAAMDSPALLLRNTSNASMMLRATTTVRPPVVNMAPVVKLNRSSFGIRLTAVTTLFPGQKLLSSTTTTSSSTTTTTRSTTATTARSTTTTTASNVAVTSTTTPLPPTKATSG